MLEASSLRVHLSQHKIQTKYFSLDEDESQLGWVKKGVEPRNLLIESARFTRGTKDLLDLKKIQVESYQALIIPPFMSSYDSSLLSKVYQLSLIRSTIQEFQLRKRFLVAIGPSSINLVGKALGTQLRPYPGPKQGDIALQYNDEFKLISLQYKPKLLDEENPLYLGQVYDALESCVHSLKQRVNQNKGEAKNKVKEVDVKQLNQK